MTHGEINSMMATNQMLSKTYESVFENAANSPSGLKVLMESRALIELGQLIQSFAHIPTLPNGDRHPVIVIPGFLTDDKYTSILRWFLKQKNYDVYPWTQGINLSFNLRSVHRLQKQIYNIRNLTNRKVSLVGWSLGGIYARYVSHSMPEHIRHVITLGTPFSRTMTSTMITRFFEFVNKQKFSDLHPDILQKITQPLPVASTSIYSKMDGVIAWECSICPAPKHNHEHIEVESSHIGLTHNPASLYAIADRLALPENSWHPFETKSIENYMKDIKSPRAITKSLWHSLSQSGFSEIKPIINSLHDLFEELTISKYPFTT